MLVLVHPYTPATRAVAIAPADNDNGRPSSIHPYAPPALEGGLADRIITYRFWSPVWARLLVPLVALGILR